MVVWVPKINQLIRQHLDDVQQHDIQLIWQCGNLYADDYTPYSSANIHVMPFIDDMPAAYALADVVVSRAGALAISELCLMGKPTLFIPSPNVAENHQEKMLKRWPIKKQRCWSQSVMQMNSFGQHLIC